MQAIKLLILRLSIFHTAMLLSVPGVLVFLISVCLLFRCCYVCLVSFAATCVYILSKTHDDLMVYLERSVLRIKRPSRHTDKVLQFSNLVYILLNVVPLHFA